MPRLSLKLSHKALILVAVPLFFELAFCGILAFLLAQSEAETFRERHARAIVAESNSLLKNFMDAGIFIYLYKTMKQDYMKRQIEICDEIPRQFHSLKIMVADSPRQKEMIERLEAESRRALQLMTETRRVSGQDSEVYHWTGSNTELAEITQQVVEGLRSFVNEQELIEETDTNAEGRTRVLIRSLLAFGVVANIAIAVGLALYFNKGTTNRLLVLVDNTQRLQKGEVLAEPVKGSDEIAFLDSVFHKMADALKEAASRKQELVNMVTHDLRTPLHAIQTTLTLLGDGVLGELPEKANKKIGMAQKSSARLIGLINDLLDIEKLEAGHMKLDLKNTPVQAIFDASLSSVYDFAEKQGVKIECPESDLVVCVDADRMVQVIVNLLSNAVKFSPTNSVVTLLALPYENMVELRVIDQGRGIPESHREKIFDRFSQVDPDNPAEKKGTGLGLPICKLIVEGHGGKIGVESVVGEGSTFWCRLPGSGQSPN